MDTDIQEGVYKWFGHRDFRPGQREAVEAVLRGRDAIVVMPTGSGKSLCYQLAAMLLPGTTLVISPLIALMKDQVDALQRKNLPATFINSTLSAEEMEKRMERMVRGEYKLVYIAPERFQVESFTDCLVKTELSLMAVDEAHCISQWGHDFRPDYLEIGKVLSRFPGLRVMAVTATATPEVQDDIRRQLSLGAGGRLEPFAEVLGFARPNLHIAVTEIRGRYEKVERAVALIRAHRIGIVYVATRKHAVEATEQLSLALENEKDMTLLTYHGAMSDAERAQVQESFMQARYPVVVATNAFGMGVDRADLRFVLHWDIPGGLEAYYQEIGRAGRDGQRAWCELLFHHADVRIQRFFNDGANPTWDWARRVLRKLRQYEPGQPIVLDADVWTKELGIENGIAIDTILNVFKSQGILTRSSERHSRISTVITSREVDEERLRQVFEARREKARRDDARLDRMVGFCNHYGCRHAYILQYFGDCSDAACGGCDNCQPCKRGSSGGAKVDDGINIYGNTVSPVVVSPPKAVSGDLEKLLRRYVAIQEEVQNLEAERVCLRDRIAAMMRQLGEQIKSLVLDGRPLKVRCLPKTTYSYDEQLLKYRLGENYADILEPDVKKMKAFMPEVVRLLRPILPKIGTPSRSRIQEQVESGRIERSSFAGAFTRKEDMSFAVTHPQT